ncbi:citrate synthase [Acidimicrobium ferrooxidans DSM 10331]|uniref:citrate synthase (unknown stereospecificity) n=1 Tax=Acidimicrobium ferrooxidans (strain DSM 10331 / JCM 15462 / NBRC 103882 / ICP) TaxID=525909 RepID=C7M2D4_ACIFD|nr:citryl-CoA lyase [Acidimicrobium ferrooxidans]ACU54923.1 citrate synthase [Acidimicrobium ferrooxidans DSM 10331]
MSTPEFPTSIGVSTPEAITLLGADLAGELMGSVSFGELAFWLVTGRRPSAGEVRVFEACLVSLADHGFTPTAIAARLTLLSAPESIQGALAAGILGGGSRFLGVTEDTGRFLADALARAEQTPQTASDFDAIARDAVASAHRDGRYVPGLGHPVHKERDPRTGVLMELARREGAAGPHVALFEAIGRVHADILGRRLPLNGAGAAGAVLWDLGIEGELARGVVLLARTAGILGHLAEERRRPIAMDVYLTVDRGARYVAPGASDPTA